jgi:hypothetical protein
VRARIADRRPDQTDQRNKKDEPTNYRWQESFEPRPASTWPGDAVFANCPSLCHDTPPPN